MTKKRYDKSTDLSRSATDAANSPPSRRRRTATGESPYGEHFEALQPESEPHPVDVIVDSMPLIATLSRDLARRADRIKAEVKDRAAFVDYEDLRLHVRTEREIAYFNIGHEYGQVVGRAESLAASTTRDSRARGLAREVQIAVTASALPQHRVAALLLELSRSYVLGIRPPKRRGAR